MSQDAQTVDLAPITKAIETIDGKLGNLPSLEQYNTLNKSVLDLSQKVAEISITTKDNELEDPLLGFKSENEFWLTLLSTDQRAGHGLDREASRKRIFGEGGYVPKVKAMLTKAADGFNEAVDSDGGIFLVPQISSTLLQTETQLASVASMAMNFSIGGLTYEMNALVDKNHSTSVAGGITVSRKPEGVSPAKSSAAFEKIGWKVTKQTGYTDLTEEVMADVPALASLVPMLFGKAFESAAESDFVYDGSGAGEPLAMLHANNPALVTVSKETGQAADTIVLENILKMRTRCHDYGSAVWLATQDIIPQVATMLNGNVPIFLASGTQDVPDTILGRPVRYTEHASALGDLNDFALVAPKHYGIANRQGVTQQSSVHVRFLQGETTLRFVKRNDGQPLWKSALTPIRGNTRSPFINLQAR